MTIYSLDVLLFPIWNQSVVPCPVLTVASWPEYRFLQRQVRWPGIPISWRIFHSVLVIHTVKGFGRVNKAEIDVFLELSCFFHDPADVGNLISGSSAFLKTSLNIRKFTVHILLKPGSENFEHYFTSMWDECNPLALFVVMLSKAHLTSHSRMSGSRLVITPSWLSGLWRFFCTVLLCILATSS